MADPQDPFSMNVIGVTDLVQNDTNKISTGVLNDTEGLSGDKYDKFAVSLTDDELLKLRDTWEKNYASYESKMKKIFERNLQSYLGRKKDGQWLVDNDMPLAANLQFEAEETFLAAALSKNPQPVVYADNSPEGNAIANDIKTMLQFHADALVMRKRLGVMVRQWSIYQLGVIKPGFNTRVNDITLDNRKIQDFIFDPNGYVDAYGDFTSYLGERITVSAERLIELYPKHKAKITLEVDGALGSNVTYTEWWTDEYCFITFKDVVLDKFKNPYYRYEEKTEALDMFGQPVISQPRNHFAYPKKPYVFLSVFSLQEQPHDITGLIEQNIPNQNLITKRVEQIDFNISASNNGYAFSEDNFNQETAKQAAGARRKGNPILIPSGGPIDRAILPLPAIGLPADAFNELESNKNNLRTSWGVQGITAEPTDEDQTARGMILNQSHDTSRIGGGIGFAVEQVADNLFNWFVQLYHVFYDEAHFAAIMGSAKAVEYVKLSNESFDRQLIVSVAPDSLRPRDEVTEMNLAQALFDKGAIGPKTLLKMLSFPNADEAAADGVLYKLDPMAYMQLNFPEYSQQLQAMQQQQAQQQMVNQAQGAAMTEQAKMGIPPEQITEPTPPINQEPASAALSNVPLQ
jgi:hypothetical protein